MAQIGISIEKETSFRGSVQPFSNVYHYRYQVANTADFDQWINEIVTIEKTAHASAVTWKYARVWSSGGTALQNQMLYEKSLSGGGTQPAIAHMDRERALLMQWPAGRNVRGKPVYLRKWFHTCGNSVGQSFTDAELANTAEILAAKRTTIQDHLNQLRLIGPADQALLVAASGREHTGPGVLHRFIEHHQLGDQWR